MKEMRFLKGSIEKKFQKIFKNRYCHNCFFRQEYFDYQNSKRRISKNTPADIKKLKNFNEKIQQAINSGESIIRVSEDGFVTIKVFFDDKGMIDKFSFKGYFDMDSSYATHTFQAFAITSDDLINKEKLNPNKEVAISKVESFFIRDIQCEHSNVDKGYGTILMNTFLEYIKPIKVKCVEGRLSSVDTRDRIDKEHKARLYHFYKKFGFEIDEKEHIKLDLTNQSNTTE